MRSDQVVSVKRLEQAREQCQSAAATVQVNLSFLFLSRLSRHLIDFYTTIAALHAQICPQNLTNFDLGAHNSTAIIT